MKTYGLIPAAGKSRRMGRPKLLLPVAGKTVLEHVVSAVRAAGVDQVLVVVAPPDQELARLAQQVGAHVFRLGQDTPDMRATCMQGLAWIEHHFRPDDGDHWLLLPADHPTVRSEVVTALLNSAENQTIVVPTHEGKRGHPTLLRWSLVRELQSLPEGEGLNSFIRSRAAQTWELPWPSDEVLRDLDTPADYARLLGK